MRNFFNFSVKTVFSGNISCFSIQVLSNYKILVSYLTQKTIKKNVSFSGVALHNGVDVNICIKPANPNFGIVFKRVDLKSNNFVYPNFMNVSNTSLNTTVENEFGVKVSTIEHLMGALFGLGIDNALIEIDNEEVPILDGSAKIFIEKIILAGIEVSEQPIKIIKINKEIQYSDGERFISIKPSTLSLEIDFELKYKNQIIGNQRNKVKVYEDDLADVYNSRTFCLFEDIELIKKNGLAKGGSLENAIVVKDNEVLNPEGLRNDKEFVNHKILDCIGDLYTSGYRIVASIKCSQGGHYLTNQLLRKLFKNRDNFSILEIKEKNLPHTLINKQLLRHIA
ncbi:UDP-3-O-acyl-N-acetylglucosamine deacetylase [Candidatus Pelagibacter communis]|uniref:UDP-3-O-acyl-N-acetylglucosamine deacetylase n=1 Tax=Pelagibacter ubique TaxID=198252 RepID=UPI00211C9E04|nr:UDP-3-O-acyl-N-acetylglucosamine deacetylase [Candidatus Pelagibacter ubique]